MKRRACVVVASEMTVRAFLVPHLRAMQDEYDVTVVVNTSNAGLLSELGIDGTLVPLAIERRMAPWCDLAALWSLYRLMRAARFDIVHSMTPKAGVLAMTAAWLARIPVRIHTFTGQVWATRRGLPRAILRALDTVLAHAATFTVADSPSQREFLIREGVAYPATLAVLGKGSVSGVDAARFKPNPEVRRCLRERLGIPQADIVVLFVGRLTADKGLLDLARAFDAIATERCDLRLLIVGPDEDRLREAIGAACRRHLSRVHFLEFADRPEDVMAASDVLCLPSYREGFGSVIIEAAACGLPSVASRIYGIVDAVDDRRTGLLHQPGDIEGLAAELRRITGDPDLRRSLGSTARARAEQEFSPHRLTSALVDLYAALLDGVPHPVRAPEHGALEMRQRPSLAPDGGTAK